MKRVEFYKTNRSGSLLHIETEGCVVNIRVNLHNTAGKEVTSVEIIPDGKDQNGGNWVLIGDHNNRIVREVKRG